MGWKVSIIGSLVETPPDLDELAHSLGYSEFDQELALDRALYPAPGLSLAYWNGAVILFSEDLTMEWLHSPLSTPANQRFLAAWPKQDIYAGSLHSVSDYYGFSWVNEANRIRCRVGCADEGDMILEGTAFEWESQFHSSEDDWFDGEGAVFHHLMPLFGCRMDEAAEELFALPFRRYKKKRPESWLSGARTWFRRIIG